MVLQGGAALGNASWCALESHNSAPAPPCGTARAGDILVKFRDSIKNWAVVKAGGNLQGWDDATPAYLWSGVVLDFELRVREV